MPLNTLPVPTTAIFDFDPLPPPSLSSDYLSGVYAELRQLEKSQAEVSSTYTTPRTLLSIIRLSMALAKLRFDKQVRTRARGGGRSHCYSVGGLTDPSDDVLPVGPLCDWLMTPPPLLVTPLACGRSSKPTWTRRCGSCA